MERNSSTAPVEELPSLKLKLESRYHTGSSYQNIRKFPKLAITPPTPMLEGQEGSITITSLTTPPPIEEEIPPPSQNKQQMIQKKLPN